MNKITLSFITTILAGLSTIIGLIPCFFSKKNKDHIIAASLTLGSSTMLTISLTSLIPETSTILSEIYKPIPAFLITAIFIIIGIIFSTTINKKIEEKIHNTSLYKLGIFSAIILMFHNIPEGITTFISTNTNNSLGLKLAIVIALHNIPEGISTAIPIYYSTNSKMKAFLYTLISGMGEFLGAIIAYTFLRNKTSPFTLSIILAITAGIMIHIAVYEFLPNSFDYQKNKVTIYYFVLGILIILLTETFLF